MVARILMFGVFVLLAAHAQAKETLTVLVGFAAGGHTWNVARVVADEVKARTGRTVKVETMPGAAGFLAAAHLSRSADADVVLFMPSTTALKVSEEMNLVPVALLGTYPYAVVVLPGAPQSLDAYMAAARTDRKLRFFASSGAGSVTHLAGLEMFGRYNVLADYVPFRGAAHVITNVLGGHVALGIVPESDAAKHEKVGNLRVIARSGQGLSAEGWMGVFVSPRASAEAVSELGASLKHAIDKASEKLAAFGVTAGWEDAGTLRKIHGQFRAKWLSVAEKHKIKIEH
jgi:tripartite-type tricarboxylate transporter receptor subunit TctC